ncbi:hypothetical protein F0U60_18175 [Archangium minus]|uniref:Uncharacterized protein n=2 Tax=Archangium minus TaxID=83450 RepID=A0ABY9WPU5_9BACT|nr:hypothetical protein F0U60_18175 [Archangium minus]
MLPRAMRTEVKNDGLFCELYWGTTLNEARSFGPELTRVLAAPDETVPLPLYGFTLPEEPFLLAERTETGYRVFVPPAARLERSRNGDAFGPVPDAELRRTGERAWLELTPEDRLRILEGELSLVLAPSVAGKREAALKPKDLIWLAMGAALFLSLPVGFLFAGPSPEKMAESNARAIAAAREREQAERKRLGVDTPARPITQEEQPDAGTKVLPANLGVY